MPSESSDGVLPALYPTVLNPGKVREQVTREAADLVIMNLSVVLGAASGSTTSKAVSLHGNRPGGPPHRPADMKLVLIADDHAPSLEFACTVLEDLGYAVCAVSDGIAAVASALMLLPDLIILDLQMPQLDGFGVLRELKADGRFDGTAFMALTALAMKGDKDKALAAGFDSWVPKPVSVGRLRSAVMQSLRLRLASDGPPVPHGS